VNIKGWKPYEVTGNWPALTAAVAANIPTKPGKLTYTKITVGGSTLGTQFLAESCSIADYNGDGIPDVSAGRRWYQGPDFQTAHIFRGSPGTTPGHGPLPRLGTDNGGATSATAELYNGVSDDWADWPWDVNGDGLPDIINMASSEMNTINSPQPKPQTNATIYWYQNPGMPNVVTDYSWTPHLMHADIRGEHHNMCDLNNDGNPEITGDCKGCTQTKGFYMGDWTNPTNAWTFIPTTRQYVFPFGGTGWMHGMGCGDVDGDGKADVLDRSGIYIQPATGAFGTTETCTGYACSPWQWVPQTLSIGNSNAGTQGPNLNNTNNDGGATMFVYDIDGDGDMDIVTSDWAHGWGLSWYEQTQPVKNCIGHPSSLTAGGPAGGTLANCFTQHVILPDNGMTTQYSGGVATSENHAAQVMDMDGDGLPDLVTGKEWLAHPFDQGDPDPHGIPWLFVWKLVRDANPPASGKAHFEAHQVDPMCNATCWGMGTGPGGTTSLTPCCTGVGRQITVGHANTDGIPDICASTKLGLYVFLGQ
jgi:hypothetical protein